MTLRLLIGQNKYISHLFAHSAAKLINRKVHYSSLAQDVQIYFLSNSIFGNLLKSKKSRRSLSNYKSSNYYFSKKTCTKIYLKMSNQQNAKTALPQANNQKSFETDLELHSVISTLKEMIPLEYASSWDNVGLLIEPSPLLFVKNIMLTIDLTEKVLDEAISKDINLIIAYHPPLFKPMKSLNQSSWKERVAIRCIENKIAVFSPHTALDAINGGINDWLLSQFECLEINPIERIFLKPKQMNLYEYNISFSDGNEGFFNEVTQQNICLFKESDSNYRIYFNADVLTSILALFQKYELQFRAVNVSPKLPLVDEGIGRIGKLSKPITISEIVEIVKGLLNLSNLRLALSNIHTKDTLISSIAVCAGSGSSVLRNVPADLYITGEMSHHEVLDIVHSGVTVILCEHTNTERGYLQTLKTVLENHLKLNITISELDADPLKCV